VTGRQSDSVCSAVAPLVGSALFLKFFFYVYASCACFSLRLRDIKTDPGNSHAARRGATACNTDGTAVSEITSIVNCEELGWDCDERQDGRRWCDAREPGIECPAVELERGPSAR
jgi:hypothetical protein